MSHRELAAAKSNAAYERALRLVREAYLARKITLDESMQLDAALSVVHSTAYDHGMADGRTIGDDRRAA